MPSYRDMLALPHDPTIGEALREDRLQRARAEYAEACRKLRRDPVLTAFETGDHTPVETIRFDIAADYQWMKPVVTGWVAHNVGNHKAARPPVDGVMWIRTRGGQVRSYAAHMNEYNMYVWTADKSKCSADIVAYSTDEECPT